VGAVSGGLGVVGRVGASSVENDPKGGGQECPPHTSLRGVFFDLDAQGFQEFEVLIADFEFGIAAEGGDQGSLVGGFVAGLADADGGFEYQENVVAAFFDAGDDFGDLIGVGERLVDGFPQFLHELLEFLVHAIPLVPGFTTSLDAAAPPRAHAENYPRRVIVTRKLDKIDDDVASLYRQEIGDRGPGCRAASAQNADIWRGHACGPDDGVALGWGARTVVA
jgi:hypothetical protein